MKHIFKIAMTVAFISGITATSFAAVNPNTKLTPNTVAEKQTSMRKPGKHRRHSVKKTGHGRRTSHVRRGYRLTNRQRRYWNQKLLDIYL